MSFPNDVAYPEQCVSEITDFDILLGRGKTSFNHIGNQRFRKFIAMNMDTYHTSKNRFDKSMVFNTLLAAIQSCGGRFLQQIKGRPGWFLVDDKLARDKISHAIRDAIAFRKANPVSRTHTMYPTTTSSVQPMSAACMDVFQEELSGPWQQQSRIQQERGAEIMFDHVNQQVDSVQRAFELTSAILSKGASNHMEHDESFQSLAGLLNNNYLSTNVQPAMEMGTVFCGSSPRSAYDIFDSEDKQKNCDHELSVVMEHLKTRVIEDLGDAQLQAIFATANCALMERVKEQHAMEPIPNRGEPMCESITINDWKWMMSLLAA